MVSDFVSRREFPCNELMRNPPAWQYGHYGELNTDQSLHAKENQGEEHRLPYSTLLAVNS